MFQESVRKAADMTLKTLSKVKLFGTIMGFVFIFVIVCVHMRDPGCLPVSRCVLVCVSLQAPQPRGLWR